MSGMPYANACREEARHPKVTNVSCSKLDDNVDPLRITMEILKE